MGIHESGINYRNMIRNLADMYPYDVAEVVLVELVANSLDARPSKISIDFDPVARNLVVTDDGQGMTATDFAQYHDFAAGLKVRGTGIGFAGVGAKISFNIASRVITETCSASFSGGSNWYLRSHNKLVWEDIEPSHLSGHGTRVEVMFDKALTFGGAEDLFKLLRRHYLPLLIPAFLNLYERQDIYPKGLTFVVNGKPVAPIELEADFALEAVRKFFPERAGKKIGYGVLGLAASEYPIAPDLCGVLLCTHGKVIKADLFNQFPGPFGPRIVGVVESPEFVKFITTSKTDFSRRFKPAEFERLYGPIRDEFKAWLAEIGVKPTETLGTDEAAKLEREIKRLIDDVPELGEFFGFRTRKDILRPSGEGSELADIHEGTQITFPSGEGELGRGPGPRDVGDEPGQALVADQEIGRQPATPISRTAKRGPKIAFADQPDRLEMAWVDGNNVVVNSGHPSHIRVRSDPKARTLQSLFAVASAIQRLLASEPDTQMLGQTLMFTDRMMAAWGKK